MVKEITGAYVVEFQELDGPLRKIDFTPPFKRVSMIDGLEEAAGIKFPTRNLSEPGVDKQVQRRPQGAL